MFIVKIKDGERRTAELACEMVLRDGQVYMQDSEGPDAYTDDKTKAKLFETRLEAESETLQFEEVISA